MVRKPGANVKLLLIGGLVGLAIGVGLTALYFALAEFFAVNARAASREAPRMATKTQKPQPPQIKRKAG
jgi:sorbitol-specific phosphotransferase system component IIBC